MVACDANTVAYSPHSLEAVSPSLVLLEEVLAEPSRPLWINADILSGPGGQARPLEPQTFLSAVRTLPTHTVLSLGWTTGWTAGMDNPGEHTSVPLAVFTWRPLLLIIEVSCKHLS